MTQRVGRYISASSFSQFNIVQGEKILRHRENCRAAISNFLPHAQKRKGLEPVAGAPEGVVETVATVDKVGATVKSSQSLERKMAGSNRSLAVCSNRRTQNLNAGMVEVMWFVLMIDLIVVHF